MLIERHMQRILGKIAKSIQVEIDVLNSDGEIVASSNKPRIGIQEVFIKSNPNIEEKNRFIFGGRTYMKFNAGINRIYYLSMEGTSRAIRNYCILAISLLELYLKTTIKRMDKEDTISAALLGQVTDLELQEAVENFNIDVNIPRCVFVIRTEGKEALEIYRIMLNAFPKHMKDYLVLVDSQTIGLVKTILDDMDKSDLMQLGVAIEETILNEASVKSYIGIGKIKDSIYDMRESYLEAESAINIGIIHEP